MKIEVHLHTTLRLQTPDGTLDKFTIDLPGGSSIQDVLEYLSIGINPDSLLLVLNGRNATVDHDRIIRRVTNYNHYTIRS